MNGEGKGREAVLAAIGAAFSGEQRAQALDILDAYASSSEEGEARVQLAILALGKGDLEELRRWTTIARGDFRDVLLAAASREKDEAEERARTGLPPEEQERLRREDRERREREQARIRERLDAAIRRGRRQVVVFRAIAGLIALLAGYSLLSGSTLSRSGRLLGEISVAVTAVVAAALVFGRVLGRSAQRRNAARLAEQTRSFPRPWRDRTPPPW